MPAPFQRGEFSDLPDQPKRPHDFFAAAPKHIEMRSKAFGDIDVHYRDAGDGPPLLLIHGLMTSSYSWRYVFGPLAERYRVIAPDLPGAGRSGKPTSKRFTASSLASWIGELQDHLGIRGCAVIGNSLGGYISMRLALDDPGSMSSLINIHSPGVPEPRIHALHNALKIPGLRRGLAWFVRRSPQRWAWRNVHYWDESLKSLEEAREYGRPLGEVDGSLTFVRYLAETLAPADMASFVSTLRSRKKAGQSFPVPLLMIYAKQDPMVPPRIGEKLAALLPHDKIVWLEESSHFAHVDTPERLLEPVLGFLANLAPSQPAV